MLSGNGFLSVTSLYSDCVGGCFALIEAFCPLVIKNKSMTAALLFPHYNILSATFVMIWACELLFRTVWGEY